MTDEIRALGKLVGISFMIGLMVVGCGQGTLNVSDLLWMSQDMNSQWR